MDTYSLFLPFKYNLQNTNVEDKPCPWLDLNREHQEFELTILQTEPQPAQFWSSFVEKSLISVEGKENFSALTQRFSVKKVWCSK